MKPLGIYADIQILHNGLDNLSKGQGNDGQVVAVEPQRRNTHQRTDNGCHQRADHHRRRQAQAVGGNRQRSRRHSSGKSAHAHEARVPQAQLTQHAYRQVQA